MSKIGRRPIKIGDVQIEINGQDVHYKGKNGSGIYVLPDALGAKLMDKELIITPIKKAGRSRDINRIWGLHRALVANAIHGAGIGFEKKIEIIGLGYKAALSGKKIVFSLGYSHKIDFELPEGVSLEIDRTGQKLTFKSSNKQLVGYVCSEIRALRPPEPYKGTGVKLSTEVITRKAGKAKAG